jgi:hypothetical protein
MRYLNIDFKFLNGKNESIVIFYWTVIVKMSILFKYATCVEYLMERDHVSDQIIDRRIILKWILSKLCSC